MEGRWAVLAVRAHRTGALDYSRETGQTELLRERMVHLDEHRELYMDVHKTVMQFFLQAGMKNGADMAHDSLQRYLSVAAPWDMPKVDDKAAVEKVKNLAEYYEKVMGETNGGRQGTAAAG